MLHEMAEVTGRPIQAVMQAALEQLLGPYEGRDLRRAAEPPFQTGPHAIGSVRRTVSIRDEQNRVLRSCRLLFGIQASDLVRQAITRHYAAICGDR